MSYTVQRLHSQFDSLNLIFEEESKTVWKLWMTCSFNVDINPYLRPKNIADSELLEFHNYIDNSIGVVDLNIIDSIPNEHLVNLSKQSGLPLSIIFGFSKQIFEDLLVDVFFPGCYVRIKTLKETDRPLVFEVYRRLKLSEGENIKYAGSLIGRRVQQDEITMMGYWISETISVGDHGNSVDQDKILWTHPKFVVNKNRVFVSVNDRDISSIFPQIKKLNLLDKLLRIGKPEQRHITYFEIRDRYVYLIRSKIEAYEMH
jgi:hypothetical protein